MPGPFTHLMICQAAKNLDEFLGEELWKFLNKYYQFLFLGAESPDLPYLSIGVGGNHWADVMHYDQTNSQVISGFAALAPGLAGPDCRRRHQVRLAHGLRLPHGGRRHRPPHRPGHCRVPMRGMKSATELCEMTMDSLIFRGDHPGRPHLRGILRTL